MKFRPAADAEVLFKRHEVGQRLAGMLEVGERIDHRHARVGGHLGDGVVRVGAQHDHVDPALHVARHVGDGFALAERRVGLVDEDRVAAHGVDAGLEGQARAQAGLLKHQHHLLGVERVAILARIALHVVAELEDGAHFGAGEIGDGAHVLAGQPRGGGQNIGVLLHGNCGSRRFDGCSASHGCFLLRMSAAMRVHAAACSVKISSSAAMAVSTCARSRMYGGRKRSTVSLVQLMRMRRLSISATMSLASSAESSSAAIIRPLPRTSTIASWRAASARSCCLEVVADFGGVGQQAFLFDRVDHGDGHGAGQRPAAECGAVHAGVNRARNLFRAKNRAQRNAAGKRLGQRGHIGLNAVVLIGAPLAGAAHAGLNLIHDQQRAGRAGQRARFGEKLLRERTNAAFALDGFDENGADFARRTWRADRRRR